MYITLDNLIQIGIFLTGYTVMLLSFISFYKEIIALGLQTKGDYFNPFKGATVYGSLFIFIIYP